ncbi:VOC family protein [Frankia sp. Mgl5]|uniref:VOC family protein n=1 Tax=Frankia sp. Mgl5 TaxID=2933793 RepID=UPI00200E0585|nr:VOC family protein [Frankia sp. Mgl5]MCK9929084.1 VOC family protein [Frankia sp. Mgl5]
MDSALVAVKYFSHIGITVTDLAISVQFYSTTLGFRQLFSDIQESWTRIGMGIGDITLELFSPHPGRKTAEAVDSFYPQQFGQPKIALTVADVEATYERLAAAGVTPLCPVTTTRVSRFFFISDPDGTPIQLHEFTGGLHRLSDLFSDEHGT